MKRNIKLIFIRHGDTNINTGKLTMRGTKQIKDALKYIKDEEIQAIFCSPRTRTLQTANIINNKFNVPLFIIKELNERQILNSAERLLYGEDFNNNYLNYAYENDKFETCKDFIDRCFVGLEKILSKAEKNSTILLCAHSSTLYAINAFLNGIPKDNQIQWLQCSNGTVIKFHL
ncbi:MAG: histidine phosphatase family protein [Clostridia bacterium]|nr:histidine phosphatase family protein [Clostridia bacterium]